ncbi:MBL fold metallo-hydrolase [bacterium]|nr:MBL fold metallo-hydrolase [bacterium]
MRIKWLGHSSFLIEASDGTRIITDPFEAGSYDGAVGYAPISASADIVTISHDHADHNAVDQIGGDPAVVRGGAEEATLGIPIVSLITFHDENKGQDRGRNTIHVLDVDGVRVGHLGDLGHTLSDSEAQTLGVIDVLLAPVGGYYTIGPEEARDVAEKLGARIVIPMHYKTEDIGFPIQPVDDFLKLMENVEQVGSTQVEITKETLPETRKVLVLDYK